MLRTNTQNEMQLEMLLALSGMPSLPPHPFSYQTHSSKLNSSVLVFQKDHSNPYPTTLQAAAMALPSHGTSQHIYLYHRIYHNRLQFYLLPHLKVDALRTENVSPISTYQSVCLSDMFTAPTGSNMLSISCVS